MQRRLVVVTNDFPPQIGGIETYVEELLKRLGTDEAVVITSAQSDSSIFDDTCPAKVVRLPQRVLLPNMSVRREIARHVSADTAVWYGAAAPLALTATTARRSGASSIVASTHGHEVWWSRLPLTKYAIRRIGRHVDALTYLGPETLAPIAQALREKDRSKLKRVVPGVDTSRFVPLTSHERRTVRERWNIPPTVPVAVAVSRLVPRKGQHRLIDVWPRVVADIPEAVLVLVGDGSHRRDLQNQANSLGLGDSVIFTGEVTPEDLPRAYALGDVFALPVVDRRSGLEVEGLGIVFLEAAACGVPVVAGRSGGSVNALDDGVTGFLVDGSDSDDLHRRLIQLLSDTDLAKSMGDKGRRFAQENWSWENQAHKLAALLWPDDIRR